MSRRRRNFYMLVRLGRAMRPFDTRNVGIAAAQMQERGRWIENLRPVRGTAI
jgi:hypothetical protein